MIEEFTHFLNKEFGKSKVLLCASSGLDSTVLAYLLKKAEINFGLFFADSPIRMRKSKIKVKLLSKKLGVPLFVEYTNELLNPLFLTRPDIRCYLCKKELFSKATGFAEKNGYDFVFDGTNKDDCADYRPGFKALKEFGIRSPFLEFGLGKKDIKDMKNKLVPGLPEEPTTCFATRFIDPKTAVNPSFFSYIEEVERSLSLMGFSNIRARVLAQKILIQVRKEEVPLLKNVFNMIKYPIGYSIEIDEMGYRPLGKMI